MMEILQGKSANQLYKEQKRSGLTNMDFKTWLNVQKAKGFSNITGNGAVPLNSSLNSSIQNVITKLHQEGGLQTSAGSTYLFGINKKALLWTGIGIGVIVTGIIIYKVTR